MVNYVICNICGAATDTLQVEEQMLGLHEVFTYYICIDCGHAHLEEIPADMAKYYHSKDYYSFNRTGNGGLQVMLQRLLVKLHMTDNLLFSRSMKGFLRAGRHNKNEHILDYGCGAGYFVEELQQLGFRNAKGYDPFLTEDISNKQGLYLAKSLATFDVKQWDTITLNHVFEHLPDPVKSLAKLRDLLKPQGRIVLRFPVIDSYAFRKYRENWVQFDAPRHINIFTRKSIRQTIEKVEGLKLIDMYDDSFHFQFTGSELYLKKASLHNGHNSRLKRILTLSTYKYHFLAKKLNRLDQGDQIVAIIEKKTL